MGISFVQATGDAQCIYSKDDEFGKTYFFAVENGLIVDEVDFAEVDCLGKCKSEMNDLEITGVWNSEKELPKVPNTKGKLFKNLHFGDIFKASDETLSVYVGVNEADEEFPYSFIADADVFYNFSANEIGETLVDSPMGYCGKKGENIFFIKTSRKIEFQFA